MPSRRPTPAPPAESVQDQLDAVRAQRAALREQLADREGQAEQTDASAAPGGRRRPLSPDDDAAKTINDRLAVQHLVAAIAHVEVACQTAGRAVVRERAQQAVEHARALRQQLLAHRARANRLKAELCEHEGARDVHLQPGSVGGMQRALRSALLRREVDEAVKRVVTLTAVAESVPLGRGWTRTYSPDDAPDLLTGPDALVYPQWDQSGGQLPALVEIAERVQAAVEEGKDVHDKRPTEREAEPR